MNLIESALSAVVYDDRFYTLTVHIPQVSYLGPSVNSVCVRTLVRYAEIPYEEVIFKCHVFKNICHSLTC